MPNATLAAVVIAYSLGLLDPAQMIAIRRVRTMEFRWAVAACLGVMVLGTLHGILAAIVLSMAGLIRLGSVPRVEALGRKPGTHVFRPRSPEHPGDETFPGLLIARPMGRLYFGNVANVAQKVRDLAKGDIPRVLLLDFSAVPGLEYTALKVLGETQERLRESGTELWLAALNTEALELIRLTPLAARLGHERMFFTVEDAVSAYEARFAKEDA
jgi:MFS superfamily sulfate permease-like transporter